jgi:probable F420-dependent oxidoreductase
MNVGLSVPLPAYSVDVAAMARVAEELGFDSLWCAEHPIMPVHTTSRFPGSADGVVPESYSHFVDPFVALARASGVTTRLLLGTGIVLVPERNPLLLAKEISTLDLWSGGRFLFGIGTGWHREETTIMGGDFDHRWTQAREAILVMKELWTKPEAEFHGRYYDFPPVRSYPKPAQRPHPPVILRARARRRVGRRVAPQSREPRGGRSRPQEARHAGAAGGTRSRPDHHLGVRPARRKGSRAPLPRCRRHPRHHQAGDDHERDGDAGGAPAHRPGGARLSGFPAAGATPHRFPG